MFNPFECKRIRRGYGIWPIRNKHEAKALYEFCKQQFKERDIEQIKLNKKRFQIYRAYMEVYDFEFNNYKGFINYKIFDIHNPLTIVIDGEHYTASTYCLARDLAGWFWS
jgi:hypothetical protein